MLVWFAADNGIQKIKKSISLTVNDDKLIVIYEKDAAWNVSIKEMNWQRPGNKKL